MNKTELIEAVSSKTDMRRSEASKAVDAVFNAIAEALKGGDKVRVVGFGTFSVASPGASGGRNPGDKRGLGRRKRVTTAMPLQEKYEIITTPHVLPVVRDASEHLSDKELNTALEAARSRGGARAAEILRGGDMLSAEEFGKLIGISRVTVNQKRRRHEVLALEGARRGFRFPEWQIGADGKPFGALPDLFDRLGGESLGGLSFLGTASSGARRLDWFGSVAARASDTGHRCSREHPQGRQLTVPSSDVVRRLPPAALRAAALDLTRVAAGARYWHIYHQRYPDPLGYSKKGSRFSDPRERIPESSRFGVLYLGISLNVWIVGDYPIEESELRTRQYAEIEVRTALNLVSLVGNGAIRIGMPSDVLRGSRQGPARRWSLALHDHPAAPDGIVYPSRLNGEINLAIYDHAVSKLAVVRTSQLMNAPGLPAVLNDLKVGLV